MDAGAGVPRLADMHCHLDRMANADEVARDAAARGVAIFCTTVTPADTERARSERGVGAHPNVRVGVGLHPWWVADGRCGAEDAARAAALAADSAFIGEVGLDFGSRGAAREAQVAALDGILAAVAAHPLPHRVLSLHAVRSAGTVLDLLERHRLVGADAPADTTCIFHWFSGTSDELARARRLGCCFSVSEHMLGSKRGREYARQLPVDRLLLETDAPPGLDTPYRTETLIASLEGALATIAQLRHADREELRERIAQTSARLLACG